MNHTDDNILFRVLKIVPHRIGTDGSGVTTLVALADCPLRCTYCINRDILQYGKVKAYTPEELFSAVSQDFCYYAETNGGVTFGGGEPLLQYQAIKAFREILPQWAAVNVETALNVPEEAVRTLLPCVTEWIVDIKTLDTDIYRNYTKKDVTVMRNNLRILSENVPEKCRIRIPVIPGYKEEEIADWERRGLENAGFKKIETFSYIVKDSH